jgi:hypothetical protein
MRLTVFNGSPRSVNSNSKVLLDSFLKGFIETVGNSYELFYLKQIDEIDYHCIKFHQADNVILVFPLYFDSMPAIVKSFIETLALFQSKSNIPVGFIIQSGLPESSHFKYLEKYLKKMTKRMNWTYLGSVIRGAGEGIRIINEIHKPIHKIVHYIGRVSNIGGVGYFLNSKRTFKLFYKLGQYYGKSGKFDATILTKLSNPQKLSKFGFSLFKLIGEKMYFNILLKKNNVFEQRYNQPYAINPE